MARNSIIFLVLFLSCWNVKVSFACRYTVRDVAFVDLGDIPYRLFVYANKGESEGLVAAVNSVAEDVLLDANAVIEFVDTSPKTEHPALKYATEVKDFPAVIAVGPEEETLVLKEGLSVNQAEVTEELRELCSVFIDSPVRREMFQKLPEVHSVILVVDGTDADANATTQEMVVQTIPQVEQSLEFLPKPIKEPPHMIHLTAQTAVEERVLLWALGMNPNPSEATQVALLFGRGRKLGPILRFPEDPRRRFIRSLAVVGQDCECGLDRRWMQGPMVPHLWTTKDEKVAIEKLGFDPGNPLVKAEIDRILTRGPGAEGGREAEIEDALKIAPALSYQEIALDDLVTDDVSQLPDATLSDPLSDQSTKKVEVGVPQILDSPPQSNTKQNVERIDESSNDQVFSPPGNWSYFFLIGSAFIVVIIGLYILLRSGEGPA
jgi:hypothetical protein